MRASVLLLIAGCGGSAALEPATHDDFRAIQAEEARIEHHRAPAIEGSCESEDAIEARCDALRQVCAASERICRIANDTSDADARTRCRNAERACADATRATDACDCELPE